jgi:hypothetical protein
MSFENSAAVYAESDADDEYEHASMTSPVTGSATSHYERCVSSSENTPTTVATFDHRSSGTDRLPETIITEWAAEECADFVSAIGLGQYADQFIGV